MIIPLITAFTLLGGPIQFYTATHVRQETRNVMVRGPISAVNTNAFVIGEHTIYIDPAKTGSFRQMGTIAVDARAEVKAQRVGDVLYAEQVVIMGTGQGRNQLVLTANHQQEKPPRASVNADTQTTLWVKAKGSLEQLALYLEHALKLFTSVGI